MLAMTPILGAGTQLWWYTARSGGIVAWALLTASVLWGLALSTRLLGPRPRPNWMLDLHRFLGGAAVVFTVVHVVSLMLDTFVGFGLAEVLVPFTSSYRPAAVAWGIVGFYLLVAIEATSLLRRRLSKRVWRATHFLSFPLFVFATAHGITAGTDSGSFLLRGALVVGTLAFAAFVAVRLSQVESRKLTSPTTQERSHEDEATAPRAPGPQVGRSGERHRDVGADGRLGRDRERHHEHHRRQAGGDRSPYAGGPDLSRPNLDGIARRNEQLEPFVTIRDASAEPLVIVDAGDVDEGKLTS
jgi:DMSO/TMAO reductase YedYZ heme-binding membrane subunit